MNIYIDESGSINNKLEENRYFVIALVRALDKEKLKKDYESFVEQYTPQLKMLDDHGKMFKNGKFQELKGSEMDSYLKREFLQFFADKPHFELYYIVVDNSKLTDEHCEDVAGIFNYALKMAFTQFIQDGYLPDEDCMFHVDERNEAIESRHFLENYLNTELIMSGAATGEYVVEYFDSKNNKLIQIADSFSNIYYSHLKNNSYTAEIEQLKKAGILKQIYTFPA